ncbi:hypothetical protein [Saprospira grandis]|uniref:Uncharacterized protein n=1 Tax=Saprospira grandis (strain Lewin) TaxID=984262 RepID=H6L2E6_SAPGL|nr:hypothetical protein [Saprospira grandis]AFC23604.1 hypothetical protein SGRA_0868 [Saprospira grandis str. Lewin]
MQEVIFDFSLSLSALEEDKKLKLKELDLWGLKELAEGKIFIFFEPKRTYLILDEIGIIDYLIQFRSVISSIDSGIHETFSVSSDYYNGSLTYSLKAGGDFFIRDDWGVKIKTNYYAFKKAVKKFDKDSMQELLLIYPELAENKNFQELLAHQFS